MSVSLIAESESPNAIEIGASKRMILRTVFQGEGQKIRKALRFTSGAPATTENTGDSTGLGIQLSDFGLEIGKDQF